jgi:hypothetical protein
MIAGICQKGGIRQQPNVAIFKSLTNRLMIFLAEKTPQNL